MKWLFYFSFLMTALTAHAEHVYKTHFPKDIYECLVKEGLVEEGCFKNEKQMQYPEESASVRVEFGEEEGRPYALIDYWCEKAIDNFHGIQVAYRKGQLIAIVVFDEKGRDYLAFAPFSKHDERGTHQFMLDLMEKGLLKINEEELEA